MTQNSGYVLEVLRQGEEFTLYRGRRSGEPTVLALGASARLRSPQRAQRLAHEYALRADLDSAWSVRPLALSSYAGRPLLVLEDCGGEPLDRMLDRAQLRRLELPRWLRLALELARAVGQMHRRGLVHKDIKPENVWLDDAERVRLTGFGMGSRVRRERQVLGPPEVIAGTFAYMAPEQTGRVNRSIDARSDLYALGVTLYQLLTGSLPFTAADPMEWIHSHIARQPPAPSTLVSELPTVIDAIVLKLLSKDPKDRYQTAQGLETDLHKCLTSLRTQGAIASFVLAERDVPERLWVPEKLYGRDSEIAALLAIFERVVKQGRSELVLVSGYAGIGKSSIVYELHKVLVPARGLFAAGKFDQYKRDIPYATLAQAFQALVRQLLNKPEDELVHWRRELCRALGPSSQLMIDLIPELALVMGAQPPAPRVEPHDAAARFHRVFRGLLQVFARAEHPLVLFLDDLQWLDAGTLELLQRLITDPESRHLMLIGAYRDSEVGPRHPLASTLTAINEAGVAVSRLTLAPLHVADVARLAADTLHTDTERAGPLAELVAQKTGGNPFFVIQFITALAEEGLLTFDGDSSTWQWAIDRIRAKGITDNVAVLMAAKLSRLPAAAREMLGQLACLGNTAELDLLVALRNASQRDVRQGLNEAVEAGLVMPSNTSFSFVHDRVHEAAYALVPHAERAAEHLRIGTILMSLTPPAELEQKIFEIVSHLNRGAPAITDAAACEQLAALNLDAGKRAKATSAFATAQSHFAVGRALLGDDSWIAQYQLTFELELQRAECEIVAGELAEAEARLAALSQRAEGLTDQAAVVCLAVLLCFTTGRSERAVEVALGFLAAIGGEWVVRPTETEVRLEYLTLRANLAVRPMESLGDLPAMSDPVCLATMAVLTELFPAAYAIDRYLLEFVLLRMTNLSLEHGHSESSSVAYAALNMALGSHFADFETAYRFGELACTLVERSGMDRYKARVYSCFAAFTMPWVKHLPACQPLMRHAFRVGSSQGDPAFAAYNSRNLITHLLVSGLPLEQVEREAEQTLAFARTLELGLPAENFVRQLEFIRQLRRASRDARPPVDDAWAKQNVEHQPGLAMMVCYHCVFTLQEHFFAENIPAALEAAARIDGIRWAMRSSIEEAEYDFYAALCRAASIDEAAQDSEQRERHQRALSNHYERIVVCATSCPENFAHRKALVAAEIARLDGRDLDAQALYERAVQLSREYGFVQVEGLANELAGKFHAGRSLETISAAYLGNARDCYARWGALAKVRQLDARYLLRAGTPPQLLAMTIDRPVAQLDVETVDKASQTLSSEMVLPSLLEKLMRLAVLHAGAERGLLILLQDGEPNIEAVATSGSGSGSVDVTVRRLRVSPLDLPRSALQYVLRTRERLVLDDASAQGLDPHDEYVSRSRPRSVLCLPVLKQTEVVGALYLENSLTTCAFTSDRVAVLDFLASHAAIALENARLYSELQRSEALLKKAQQLSSTGSFYWRVELDVIEYSEQTYRIYDFDPSQPVTLELMATRTHPEDLPLLQEMIDRARGVGSDLDCLYRLQMPDQSVKYLHLVAHGMRASDGGREYIGAIQDVTQRRRADEALGKVRSELAHVSRVSSLGVLTASIAHEVNQPLAGIVTNASTCLRMLKAESPNVDGARETARRMIRDAHRASDVIARLRALFARKGAPNEWVDLNEATREVIALSASELRKSRVLLRAELAADLPGVVGDRVQLQQVILNLLLNAADAMRGVDDRPRQVVIRTERDEGDRLRLTVKDAGVGIEPQSISRLFEAFYTTKRDGMGIGLSVSRAIIESHQGRLWAVPPAHNEGPGTTFAFVLPAAPTELAAAESAVDGGRRPTVQTTEESAVRQR